MDQKNINKMYLREKFTDFTADKRNVGRLKLRWIKNIKEKTPTAIVKKIRGQYRLDVWTNKKGQSGVERIRKIGQVILDTSREEMKLIVDN